MEGCKVRFFKDPVRQRVVFSVRWTTPDGACVIDDGGFKIDDGALRAAMEAFSAGYIGNYDDCKDGFEIAAVDEANDKLMAAVNEAAARAAKTAK